MLPIENADYYIHVIPFHIPGLTVMSMNYGTSFMMISMAVSPSRK